MNLKFTLENEEMFNDSKKCLLNRIVSKEKKNKIINLLNEYKIEFIDLPFEIDEFKKIAKNIPSISEYNRSSMVQTLYKHNLYLINNNGPILKFQMFKNNWIGLRLLIQNIINTY